MRPLHRWRHRRGGAATSVLHLHLLRLAVVGTQKGQCAARAVRIVKATVYDQPLGGDGRGGRQIQRAALVAAQRTSLLGSVVLAFAMRGAADASSPSAPASAMLSTWPLVVARPRERERFQCGRSARASACARTARSLRERNDCAPRSRASAAAASCRVLRWALKAGGGGGSTGPSLPASAQLNILVAFENCQQPRSWSAVVCCSRDGASPLARRWQLDPWQRPTSRLR